MSGNKGINWILVPMFGMVVMLIAVIVLAVISANMPTEQFVYESKPLHNLYDNSALEGQFFLGTGSINEEEYLFFNVIDQGGYIKPEKIAKYNSNVYIKEDGNTDPRLDIVCERSIQHDAFLGLGVDRTNCINVFHIPEGSVNTGYIVK